MVFQPGISDDQIISHLLPFLPSFTGCCLNRNSFERSSKGFLLTNLGEAED